jgi:hypothetical protein
MKIKLRIFREKINFFLYLESLISHYISLNEIEVFSHKHYALDRVDKGLVSQHCHSFFYYIET